MWNFVMKVPTYIPDQVQICQHSSQWFQIYFKLLLQKKDDQAFAQLPYTVTGIENMPNIS